MGEVRTISGFILRKKQYSKEVYLFLKSEYKLSDIISRIIASRVSNTEDIKKFLEPKIKYNLKSPENLLDIQEAIGIFKHHIDKKNRILIFGDYDVDGSCSSAIMANFLKEIDHDNFEIYIPNRFKEGYGLSMNAISNIDFSKINLLITLDCGTCSVKEIDTIKSSKKIDVIVIDHHKSLETIPNALVINPNRIDEPDNNDFKTISAAGVLFLFLSYFISKFKYQMNIMNYLDLVALSTVCDVMPLTGINRSFVFNGLSIMNKKDKKCFKILSDIVEIDKYSSYDLGFKIGPMINAGGRIGDSKLGAKFLTSNSDSEISDIIIKLNNLNQERSLIEIDIIREIRANDDLIKSQISQYGFVFLFDENWHEGVIGIIASRIKDVYHCPVIIGFEKNGTVKCSCRSIGHIDIGQIILDKEINSLLINGGGHKMAGGISFKEENFPILQPLFGDRIKKLSDRFQELKEIFYDCEVSTQGLNTELIKSLDILEPFGNQNERPVFKLTDVEISQYQVLKDKHIRIVIRENGKYINAISFNSCNTKLGNLLVSEKKCHLLVSVSISKYCGKDYISIQIIDALPLNIKHIS